MKQQYLILSASIAVALAGGPTSLMASPASGVANAALANISNPDSARVVNTVNNNYVVALPHSHLSFINKAAPSHIDDSVKMSHMQLILQPSAQRQAALKQLIADQHNPQSAKFHQWLTPQQFGNAFGVADSDIAAVTSWLTSQGFKVNNIYPNKMQIDFSGNAGLIRKAFHTQENIYTLKNGEKHFANASDISIPSALRAVVKGVMGLNDFRPKPLHVKSKMAQWNPATKKFDLKSKSDIAAQKTLQQIVKSQAGKNGAAKPQVVNFQGGTRGLVPFDLNNMYNANVLRKAGITGAGVTIAVVEDQDMNIADVANFRDTFNLGIYGGDEVQINPAPPSGTNNCNDPSVADFGESGETLLDAEWSAAMAPGAHIVVASCSDYSVDANGEPSYPLATDNFFGGVFIAATNLINGEARPNIISASYGYGEYFTDEASKTAIDAMWAQADAEGISVFVSTGDSGSNPSFNGGIINGYYGASGVDANSLATSVNVTAVGGTDTADVLDGTTSKYFSPVPNAYWGSALGYVPEIPWNESCGNGVAAQSFGFSDIVAFCKEYLKYDPNGYYVTSEAGSGGPSSVVAKPDWQMHVYDTAKDQSRDLPDVSLFAGSYGNATYVVTCTSLYPCSPDFSTPVELSGGTSLSSPMFAGIQALVDQSLATSDVSVYSGNAAPTLYALAAQEYGTENATVLPSACSSDESNKDISSCVFHNITRGSISSQCIQVPNDFLTSNCYYYGVYQQGQVQLGLTSRDAAPTDYTLTNRAYGVRPGWSFASGLGSVNAANLVSAWKTYVAAAQTLSK